MYCEFGSNENIKGAVISEIFLSNVDNLIHGKDVIHHSHITGEVEAAQTVFATLRLEKIKIK